MELTWNTGYAHMGGHAAGNAITTGASVLHGRLVDILLEDAVETPNPA